jgi:hypothetical protein
VCRAKPPSSLANGRASGRALATLTIPNWSTVPSEIGFRPNALLKFLARILTCSSWRQLYLFRFSAEIPCTESHRLHVPWAVRQTPQLARHLYVEVARKVVSSMSAGNRADDVMIGICPLIPDLTLVSSLLFSSTSSTLMNIASAIMMGRPSGSFMLIPGALVSFERTSVHIQHIAEPVRIDTAMHACDSLKTVFRLHDVGKIVFRSSFANFALGPRVSFARLRSMREVSACWSCQKKDRQTMTHVLMTWLSTMLLQGLAQNAKRRPKCK